MKTSCSRITFHWSSFLKKCLKINRCEKMPQNRPKNVRKYSWHKNYQNVWGKFRILKFWKAHRNQRVQFKKQLKISDIFWQKSDIIALSWFFSDIFVLWPSHFLTFFLENFLFCLKIFPLTFLHIFGSVSDIFHFDQVIFWHFSLRLKRKFLTFLPTSRILEGFLTFFHYA